MPEAYAKTLTTARDALQTLDPGAINLAVSELVAHLFRPENIHPTLRAELQLTEAELLLTRALIIEFERSVRIKETVATSRARVTDDTLRALSLIAAIGDLPLPPELAAQRARLVVYASILRGESPAPIEDQPLVQLLADAADLWRNPASVEVPFLEGILARIVPLYGDPPHALPQVLEALTRYRLYRIEQSGSTKIKARKLVLKLRRQNEKLSLLQTLHRGLTLPVNPRNVGDVVRRARLNLHANCPVPATHANPKVTIKVDAPAGQIRLIEVNPDVPELAAFRECVETRLSEITYPSFEPTNPNTRRTLSW